MTFLCIHDESKHSKFWWDGCVHTLATACLTFIYVYLHNRPSTTDSALAHHYCQCFDHILCLAWKLLRLELFVAEELSVLLGT